MGYPKQLNEEQLLILKPVIEALDKLSEGELLNIKDKPEALEELRYLIYAYLHHNSIKSYFKLTRPSPTVLSVYRKIMLRPEIESGSIDPKIKSFITQYLIDIEDEDQALALIKDRFKRPQERVIAHREWRRIMRGADT